MALKQEISQFVNNRMDTVEEKVGKQLERTLPSPPACPRRRYNGGLPSPGPWVLGNPDQCKRCHGLCGPFTVGTRGRLACIGPPPRYVAIACF